MQDKEQAFRMLDAFASVGAKHFDVTFINIDGEKRGFRSQQSIAQVKNSLPLLFPGAEARQNSIIVRPLADSVQLVQLDDLRSGISAKVQESMFLSLETSPGNYQAWIAVSGVEKEREKEIARRLRHGAGADRSASGATRVAGTTNYKRKYEPDFPMVTVAAVEPGRIVAMQDLKDRDLLPPEAPEIEPPVKELTLNAASRYGAPRFWPDYDRCLREAPPSHEHDGPDRSMADFFWCLMAAQRGWSVEETAHKLLEVSEKARERAHLRDEGYALITAQNAAAAQRSKLKERKQERSHRF